MSFNTKSPAMRKMLNQFALKTYGMSVSYALKHKVCVCCNNPAYLASEIDLVEYKISGLCSECQDGVFGEEE